MVTLYGFITNEKDDTPCPIDVIRLGHSEERDVVKMAEYYFRKTKYNYCTLEVYLI